LELIGIVFKNSYLLYMELGLGTVYTIGVLERRPMCVGILVHLEMKIFGGFW
jgi:hypothetical protein